MTKTVPIFCLGLASLAVVLPATAAAQASELCDRLAAKSERAAPGNAAPHREFVAKCGRDPRARAAAAKIERIEREERLRQERARAEQAARDRAARDRAARDRAARDQAAWDQAARDQAARDQAARDRAARDRAAQAAREQAQPHGITIENKCTFAIKLRLVYQTADGWKYVESDAPPEGATWDIASGRVVNIVFQNNAPVMASSGDIYYQVTNSDGTWASGQYSMAYGGVNLPFSRIVTTLDEYGKYRIIFCP